jgi:hypothetical protein
MIFFSILQSIFLGMITVFLPFIVIVLLLMILVGISYFVLKDPQVRKILLQNATKAATESKQLLEETMAEHKISFKKSLKKACKERMLEFTKD